MGLFGITKQWWVMIIPISGYAVGEFLDRQETLRMVMFRDKSALYGRTLAPGEKPSWP